MLKRLNPEISLGFVIASLLWIAVLGWQSSYSLPENEKQRCYEEARKPGHKDEECKTFWERTTSDPIAFFTFTLSIVTLALGVISFRQFYYLRRSDETARIAANAADLSARAAIALELPVIRVVPDRFGYGTSQVNDGPRTEYCAISRLIFSNAGRTQATPIEVRCGGFVGDTLPDAPTYITVQSFPVGAFFGAAPYEMHLRDFEINFESGDTDKLMNRQTTLWFFCCIAYLDFMDIRHEQVFCWKRHELFGGGAFFPDPTPAYNRKT